MSPWSTAWQLPPPVRCPQPESPTPLGAVVLPLQCPRALSQPCTLCPLVPGPLAPSSDLFTLSGSSLPTVCQLPQGLPGSDDAMYFSVPLLPLLLSSSPSPFLHLQSCQTHECVCALCFPFWSEHSCKAETSSAQLNSESWAPEKVLRVSLRHPETMGE